MNVVILGSTGSIGESTLSVIRNSQERLKVSGLVAHSNKEKLTEQAIEFNLAKTILASEIKDKQEYEKKVEELVSSPHVDVVVVAIVGFAALKPTLAALKAGKRVALANKEALVTCGELLTQTASQYNGQIIPVDSEHNALFQALQGHAPKNVRKLIITGSGGPFRGMKTDDLKKVTVVQALNHPKWKMGPKITVDSATLMNKGLEYIEARWVFGLPQNQLDVIIHPQSIIHGIVEFIDGAMLAHMSQPDMKAAISYSLYYPDRQANAVAPLDLVALQKLEFQAVDHVTFPCVQLAQQALTQGGLTPTVLNAANEIAVDAFLKGSIQFLDIPQIIRQTMQSAPRQNLDIETVFEADSWARIKTKENILSLHA